MIHLDTNFIQLLKSVTRTDPFAHLTIRRHFIGDPEREATSAYFGWTDRKRGFERTTQEQSLPIEAIKVAPESWLQPSSGLFQHIYADLDPMVVQALATIVKEGDKWDLRVELGDPSEDIARLYVTRPRVKRDLVVYAGIVTVGRNRCRGN